MAAAVLRIGEKALKNVVMWGLALLAFIAIFFFKSPFPAIIAAAGLIGWMGSRIRRDLFVTSKEPGKNSESNSHVQDPPAVKAATLAQGSRYLPGALVDPGFFRRTDFGLESHGYPRRRVFQ